MEMHARDIRPITHPDFIMYTEPIPLELAKQWDLRTLSTFLPPPITQEEIDEWYPQPQENIAGQELNEYSDSDADLIDSD